MNSFLLHQVARGVLPVTVLFAVYLLLRGHDQPGGGFVAGLVVAAALILQALAGRSEPLRRRTPRVRPAVWIGLLVAVASALAAVFRGEWFFSHFHQEVALGPEAAWKLSTTLLFDVGVFLVVIHATVTALAAFAGEGAR